MKWFYKLKSVYRILITIASWVPLVVMAGILGSSDKLSTPLTILALVFLALGIFFVVFAIKAASYERAEQKKAITQKVAAKEAVLAKEREKARIDYNAREAKARSKNDATRQVLYSAATNIESVKLTGNKNEDMQSNISLCDIGEEVEFEYNYDTNKYLAVSGCEIGVLPSKYTGLMEENYKAYISNIDLEENGNYSVIVDIIILDTISFPIYTKIVGVTFENRQYLLTKCKQGDKVSILHTPSDEYPKSIEVRNIRLNETLGHIKKELAHKFCDNFGIGFELYGSITEITGGNDGLSFGCNIIIEGYKALY